MYRLINKVIKTIVVVVICSSCTKYVTNIKTTTNPNGNQQGTTPLGAGNSGSTGGTTSSSTNSDSADAVYIQGFYLLDISKRLTSSNQTTNQSIILNANGYYTKFSIGFWNFWDPFMPPQNHSNYLWHFNFIKNGFYSVISNSTNPAFVLLQNGTINPANNKAYVRFLNLCDSADAVSINTKITSSNDAAYFSYRKPYDIYNTSVNGVRSSIDNENYNTNFTNFTTVNAGSCGIEIYLSNGKKFNPSFSFIAGKKYSIVVSQKSYVPPIEYYYAILQHN